MRKHSPFLTRLGIESLESRAMLSADPGWGFGLGGPVFGDEFAYSAVNVGPDNNLYVAGSFRGTVDFDPGAGVTQFTTNLNAQDGFIAKYTPQGALVWAKQYGQAIAPVGVGNEFSTDLGFDAAGNVYVSGWTNAAAPKFGSTTFASHGDYDAFVTKLDAVTGNFLWARSFGGIGQDDAAALAVSASGDVYVTGTFRDTVDFDPGPGTFTLAEVGGSLVGDAYVWKLNTNGDFQWARQFGSPSSDFGHRVALAGDGYVYAVGPFKETIDFGQAGNPLSLTSTTPGISDTYIVKINEANGESAWARQVSGPEKINAARIVADGAGSLYVAGGFQATVTFGAGTPTFTSAGGQDAYLSKWDTTGNFLWADQVSGTDDITPRTLRLDAAGNPLLAFEFAGTVDFDPGPSVATLTTVDAASDGAVLKLDTDGNFDWVRHISGPGATAAMGLVEDNAGNVYVSGFYRDSVTLPTGNVITNPGTGTYEPGNGTFVMKLALAPVPPTKFYVVDDASANRTYEYDATGSAIENYALNSSDSAPRGAATTEVGDKVWVVDANRKVFVYDTSGGLLGSWTAGSMSSTATPEGIATNGTDVWIVDSKSDKVYKYAGAASRVTGSQNAASSFSLNSSNRSPKDIVTDGASLWVVNDSTTDKVFKYTAAGSLLGSWTIGSTNSKPIGLTIDPTNVSDIWIVDSGTDLVYQYVGAASRTSGSQTAAASFALAAGNSNPQGIADPPPRGAMQQYLSPASGSSLASAVPASRAVGSEEPFFVRSADKASVRKSAAELARQEVFATLSPRSNYLSARRATQQAVAASEPELSGFHACADDDQAAVDLAFESAFASVKMRKPGID